MPRRPKYVKFGGVVKFPEVRVPFMEVEEEFERAYGPRHDGWSLLRTAVLEALKSREGFSWASSGDALIVVELTHGKSDLTYMDLYRDVLYVDLYRKVGGWRNPKYFGEDEK